ncbi:hypothetical protein D3C76_1339090 [compost metagenome]
MIEDLRTDPAALAPGGNHKQGHPRPQAERSYPAVGLVSRVDKIMYAGCLGNGTGIEVHTAEVQSRRTGQRAIGVQRGDGRWRYMVEESIVLIIRDEQHGFAPHHWVGHQGGKYLADVVGPAQRAGACRVFALRLRRQYPGNLR